MSCFKNEGLLSLNEALARVSFSAAIEDSFSLRGTVHLLLLMIPFNASICVRKSEAIDFQRISED